jgi:urease accessory protein
MVAVGLLSIQIGGKHILGLPLCFVLILFIGALIGLLAIPIPQVEGVISLSVIVLGIAIASQSRIGIWIAYPIVAIFAFFHGHAHGGEIPTLGNSTSYITGFLIASAILHFLGIGIGTIARTKRIRSMIGSAFAGIGLHMILLIYGLI